MSSIGINSTPDYQPRAAQTASTKAASGMAPGASTQLTTATHASDSVKLSVAGQAKLMHQEGKSPGLIASALAIKIADVDGYLGIAVQVAATPASDQSASVSEPVAKVVPTAPGAPPVSSRGK